MQLRLPALWTQGVKVRRRAHSSRKRKIYHKIQSFSASLKSFWVVSCTPVHSYIKPKLPRSSEESVELRVALNQTYWTLTCAWLNVLMQFKSALKHLKIFETLNKELPSSFFLLHLFTATFHLWFSEELEEGIEERHLRLNDSSWPEYNDSQMAANFTARTLHRIRVVRVQTHESDDNMMLGGVLLMEEESGEENRNGLMLNSINIKNSWEKRVWSIKISRQRRKCRRVGWMWPWGWLT